jgi:coatomer subunit beta'
LLLLYTATGSRQGLAHLSSLAQEACQNNIAFTCEFTLGNIPACIDLLKTTGRIPEAVLFSRTYKPSLTAELVKQWKTNLSKNEKDKLAKCIASPDGNLDLFPEWSQYLEKERGTENGDLLQGRSL